MLCHQELQEVSHLFAIYSETAMWSLDSHLEGCKMTPAELWFEVSFTKMAQHFRCGGVAWEAEHWSLWRKCHISFFVCFKQRLFIINALLKVSSQNNRKARQCRPPLISFHTVASVGSNRRLFRPFGLWTWPVIFRRSKVKAPSETKSSPKFNHLFFGPLLTFPENPIKIPLELYQLFCCQSVWRKNAGCPETSSLNRGNNNVL